MLDFAAARRWMVEGQVRTADVTDLRIQGAMLELPRERFVSPDKAELAYLDLDLPIGPGGSRAARRLLKPMVLAKLLQMAEVSETGRVLDVGSATGYGAAVLARLAASVVALEEDDALFEQARGNLAGAQNVKVVKGALTGGAPADAPFDLIVMEGATEVVPSTLLGQLANNGRLVCVLGRGPSGKAMIYRRIDGDVSGRPVFDASAPLLPGFAEKPAFVF